MHKPRDKLEILVIGCGAVGLASALRLQRDGHRVTIWARDLPPRTTSNVGAAVWYPYGLEPRARVKDWATRSYRIFRGLAEDPDCPVHMIRVVELLQEPQDRPWWAEDHYAVETLSEAELPEGFAGAFRLEVPMTEMPGYLELLLRRFTEAGGMIHQREVHDISEAFEHWTVVVNCTGLGARELAGDDSMFPIRGQVLSVPRREIPFALVDDSDARYPVYVLPRTDDVVLGGTAQAGDERTDPDPRDTEIILERCRRLAPALDGVQVAAVTVGLRPGRDEVRLELEQPAPGRRLVHNYGHGGCGVTLSWGCAEEVAALVR